MDDSDRLSALRTQLQRCLGHQRYQLWLGPHVSMTLTEGALRVQCPSLFEKNWLKSRLHQTLASACQEIWGRPIQVEYCAADSCEVSASDLKTPHQKNPDQKNPDQKNPEAHSLARRSQELPEPATEGPQAGGISPVAGHGKAKRKPTQRSKLSFGNFVVGKSNELACRTAQAVIDQLGHFGPLLLFGPTGVGKTHLLNAMALLARQRGTRIRSVRLTAEQFTTEFLAALDRRALPGFRQKYRSIDLLLIDDIQFLMGKRATLDELMHTIDALHDRGHQVVLTCDRNPGDLQKVSTDLVSRISGGLSVPIDLPDYPTRLEIVRQLAAQLQIQLDDETVALLATQVVGSPRQLKGAINRLIAASHLGMIPITADMARATLADFTKENTPVVRLPDIQRAICEVFGVDASKLKSTSKTRSLAEPRMLAMWLARKYTRAALGEIGEFFGRRSHSTVISAHKRIDDLVSRGGEMSVADRPCHVEEAIRQVESVLRSA